MPIEDLSNAQFATAIRALGRGSQTAATAAAQRADRVAVRERAYGKEINANGAVDLREMDAFARATAGAGQGLSAQEKRFGDAARVLYQALSQPGAPLMLDVSNALPAAPKPVALSGLAGNLEVKNPLTGKVVLSEDRKAFAQRIAGPGKTTVAPSDFQAAMQFLTMNERYLANQLMNELFYAQPLGTYSRQATTPGGHALRIDAEQWARAEVPTGGVNPNYDSTVDCRGTTAFTLELQLSSREVLVNAATGETHVPDRNGKVRIPVGRDAELAIVTRGVTGTVKEKLDLHLVGAPDWKSV